MKCKYCNADIEQDAQFCPNCGKDLSKFNKCIKCGELLDSDTVFCPHCGTEQPHEEKDEVKGNGFKKWLLILPIIVLLVGAGAWYLFSDGFSFGDSSNVVVAESVDSDSIAEVDEIENDPVAVEVAEARQATEEGIKELEEEEAKSEDEGYDSTLSERELTEEDLEGKTKKELELMRNSIYARYGYRFKRDDLFSHFSQFNWYNPTTSDMSTVYSSMSGIEKYNIDFIKKHE